MTTTDPQAQQPTAATEAGWHKAPLLGISIATTGVSSDRDRVVGISVKGINNERPFEHTWVINHGVELSPEVERMHGISAGVAAHSGLPARTVYSELAKLLLNAISHEVPVVVFGAQFTFDFLIADAARHNIVLPLAYLTVLDVKVLDERSTPRRRKGKRTVAGLAESYKIAHPMLGHPAVNLLVVMRIAYMYAASHPAVARTAPQDLHEMQAQWAAERAAEFNEYQQSMDRVARMSSTWPYSPRAVHRDSIATEGFRAVA
ncbi:hypothetical protein GS504_01270 [Rhodococcus hoagii]|nr:hypothetical protein [Prescottella equi]NKS71696.1 hypothetical protein [Prescottella equi]